MRKDGYMNSFHKGIVWFLGYLMLGVVAFYLLLGLEVILKLLTPQIPGTCYPLSDFVLMSFTVSVLVLGIFNFCIYLGKQKEGK